MPKTPKTTPGHCPELHYIALHCTQWVILGPLTSELSCGAVLSHWNLKIGKLEQMCQNINQHQTTPWFSRSPLSQTALHLSSALKCTDDGSISWYQAYRLILGIKADMDLSADVSWYGLISWYRLISGKWTVKLTLVVQCVAPATLSTLFHINPISHYLAMIARHSEIFEVKYRTPALKGSSTWLLQGAMSFSAQWAMDGKRWPGLSWSWGCAKAGSWLGGLTTPPPLSPCPQGWTDTHKKVKHFQNKTKHHSAVQQSKHTQIYI